MINSCGKSKQNSHDKQPTCQNLNSESKRQEVKQKYLNIAVPAGMLYIGNQAKRVRTAIDILRKNHLVDYFIISAGFGLLKENELIPPYECTFSDKGKRVITEMAEELGIRKDIKKIQSGYDLIFLILGKNYLHTLGGLDTIRSKGRELIVFDKIKSEDGLVAIDPTFLATLDSELFEVPLGNHLINKSSVLLNFVMHINNKNRLFSSWWNQFLKHNLQEYIKDKIPQKNTIHFETSGKRINKAKTSKIFNMSSKIGEGSKEEIETYVGKFTKKDIVMLTDLIQGLNTVNTKRGETRKDWVAKHDEKIENAEYIYNKIYPFVDDLNENQGDSKAKIKDYLVIKLREKQVNAGYDTALINGPRMAIIKTLVNWYKNPELQEIESVYIPRKEKSAKTRNKTLLPPQLKVTLDNIRESGNHFELILNLLNNSPYPLQNVVISLETQENFKLSINQASGNFMEVINDDVNIAFIPASIDGEVHEEKIRVISYSILDEDDKLVVKVKQDYPADNSVFNSTFEFDLE